jgi:hypothetical protein
LGQLFRAEHVRPALVTCRLNLERDPDPLQRHRRLLHHQLFVKPQHAVPCSPQRLIAARICALPLLVVAAIHLDNEPRLRCEKVNDVAPNAHLRAELRTKAPAAKGLPQTPL